jgi:pimeloyl-ACP methyl ester carboxylesterase
MRKATQTRLQSEAPARVRRGYFECRFGQLHVHNAMPAGGGFEEGIPLLCVHDLPGSGRLFTRLLALNGAERSVYAPDLPGFGESDPPVNPQGLAEYAAALGDFIDTMRLRQLAVLGVRLGALLATELAITRASQIARVVMVSVPLVTEAERPLLRSSAPPAAPSEFRPLEAQRWAQEAAADYPLRERLPRLAQPLLALRPRGALYEATGRIRELLPAARVSELEHGGDDLFFSEAPSLHAALRDFLRT